MRYTFARTFLLLFILCLFAGCSAYQPTKNVWKSTKGLWNTYVSPPASVDYEDKGSLSPAAKKLSAALMNVDMELGKLERVMQNADKPPTQEWLSSLFASFPWLNGFAGVKYDGTILGQEPPNSMKQLDFIPLLYEDKKQRSRALRADVQPGPLGPEVMLAAPLYDGTDFLGIVAAYFDMRSLMRLSSDASEVVVLTPNALLWPGKYEYGATPLAGVNWAKTVAESSSGTCSNSTGTFYYMARYLGNLPLVFAIPTRGSFPEGNGDLAQAAAFFPQEREKLPPPPMPERKPEESKSLPAFEKPAPEEPAVPEQAEAPRPPEASEKGVISAGSRESMLLKRGRGKAARRVRERPLEGENVEVIRAPERRMPPAEMEMPEPEGPVLPGGRPSPFGPREEKQPVYERPSPFGPKESPGNAPAETERPAARTESEKPAAEPEKPAVDASQPTQTPARAPEPAASENAPKAEEPAPGQPARLPGGRPSPFGPGR